ncbi:MAG: hypothetical protein MK074_05105 [Phycisphaerales bacterium]|nr:hypothetical protein [Phycisphaerales bacterium]
MKRRQDDGLWVMIAALIVVATAIGLRVGTNISDRGPVFDERWISRPMADIVRKGWTVQTAIDFQETKGPALIWPYAVWAQALGADQNEVVTDAAPGGGRGADRPEAWQSHVPGGAVPAPPNMLSTLRLASVAWFIVGGLLLLVLAHLCGVRGPPLVLVSLAYVLIPYQSVFGQLVMGEASFITVAVAMLLVVCWGMGDGRRSRHRVLGPVLYGLLLVILLHSRIHAVAFAPAVCVVAWLRENERSWPWWAASIAAGLLRIPLWVRWDGLVSSDFQNLHGLGFRLDSLTYLGAALAVPLGIFLLMWLVKWRRDLLYWLPPLGVMLGVVLSIVAMPDLSVPEQLVLELEQDRFQGIAAKIVAVVGGDGIAARAVMAVLCGLGLGGLGALICLAHRTRLTLPAGVLLRIQSLAIGAGWLLYAFTRGFVFDRYLMVWCAALPLAYLLLLSRRMLIAQLIALTVVTVELVMIWLV